VEAPNNPEPWNRAAVTKRLPDGAVLRQPSRKWLETLLAAFRVEEWLEPDA
jgi:hypothetical protein